MTQRANPESPRERGPVLWAGLIAGAAFALLLLQNSYLIAAPIQSDDLWWHLSLGEAYLAQGPWLAEDPLLYTAETAPPPSAWLFDALTAGIVRASGLYALRPFHLAVALGLIGLAYTALRRAAATRAEAMLAVCLVLVLAMDRLVVLRPQLFTIAAVLLLYRLLLEGDAAPSWRRVAVAVAGVAIWANVHAAFLLGPLLLIAALAGLGLQWVLERLGAERSGQAPGEDASQTSRWLARLAVALVLGVIAALLNPRGFAQHLSFLATSDAPALQLIGEWKPFDPLPSGKSWLVLGRSVWMLTDLVILGYAVAAVALLRRMYATRSSRAGDLRALALGAAGIVALLSAQRFVWLSFFALVFVLRMLAPLSARRATVALGAAALTVGVVLYETRYLHLPSGEMFREYLQDTVDDKYPLASTHFLQATGLSGRLFARYEGGGFLGYWLAPRLKTMVNGSMNFPSRVFDDYMAVSNHRGARPEESFRDALDRNGVDVFLGYGIPEEPLADVEIRTTGRYYTSASLEREPGWVLVQRNLDNAVYLRRSPGNAANLQRVVDYYARQGVPFDPERGLDVPEILRSHQSWAMQHGVIPTSYPLLVRSVGSPDGAIRLGALDLLATIHLLLGDYETALSLDRRALAEQPRLEAPRRRAVFALLRLGRAEAAARVARALVGVDDSQRSRTFLRLAQHALQLERGQLSLQERDRLQSFVLRLPVLSWLRFSFELEDYLAPPPALRRGARSASVSGGWRDSG